MAKRTGPDTADEILQDISIMFHTFEEAYQAPRLTPVSITVPGEILSLIADACVEPYDMRINRLGCMHSFSDSGTPMRLQVDFIPPIPKTESVSADFANGVKNGLLKSFTRHLTLPGSCSDESHDIITRNCLAWIIAKVTSVTITFKNHYPTFLSLPRLLRDPYSLYMQLEEVNIVKAPGLVPSTDDQLLLLAYTVFTLTGRTNNSEALYAPMIRTTHKTHQRVTEEQNFRSSAIHSILREKTQEISGAVGVDKWINPAFNVKFIISNRGDSQYSYTHLQWRSDGSQIHELRKYETENHDWAIQRHTGTQSL